MKYYKVLIGACHDGAGRDVRVLVPYIEATDAYSAMMKARRMGGVRHNSIPTVHEVTEAEYRKYIGVSAYVRAGFREP